jgi:hypothetical protein
LNRESLDWNQFWPRKISILVSMSMTFIWWGSFIEVFFPQYWLKMEIKLDINKLHFHDVFIKIKIICSWYKKVTLWCKLKGKVGLNIIFSIFYFYGNDYLFYFSIWLALVVLSQFIGSSSINNIFTFLN